VKTDLVASQNESQATISSPPTRKVTVTKPNNPQTNNTLNNGSNHNTNASNDSLEPKSIRTQINELISFLNEEKRARKEGETLVKNLENTLTQEIQARKKLEQRVTDLNTKLENLKPKNAKKAKALYNHVAEEDNELNFNEGDELTIIKMDPSGWWEAELNGKTGLIPAVYVTPIE